MAQDPMTELAVDEEPFSLDELDDTLDCEAGMPEDPADLVRVPAPAVVGMAERPMTFGLAEWCMRHVVAIDRNLAEIDQQWQDQLDRLNRWHTIAVDRLFRRRQFFEAQLIRYAADHRALDPKNNKTTRLPSGEIGSTEPKPAAVVADLDVVRVWAKIAGIYDDVIKVEYSPKVLELRKVVKVGTAVVARRFRATLADGQQVDLGQFGPDADEPLSVGDMYETTDGIGETLGAVAAIDAEDVTGLVVLDANGEPVPGMGVEAKPITFKVRPAL